MSAMHHLQHIADLGTVLEGLGVRHVILAPGSRNAPLVQLFTSGNRFVCHSIVDERSAGYVALGMARQLGRPVAVVTTSGTAVLNLSPAVAEAFQQNIPIVVLTADRPREILSQFDNQVTDQSAPYFNHSKGFFEFPVQVRDVSSLKKGILAVEKLVREALREPAGPVHVNLPLAEPLYVPLPSPALSEMSVNAYSEEVPVPEVLPAVGPDEKKILILAGMGPGDKEVKGALKLLLQHRQAAVVAENISNLHAASFVSNPELVLSGATEEERRALAPDLILAFGLQVVSKRLRQFAENCPDADLRSLEEGTDPVDLFHELAGIRPCENKYLNLWKQIEGREKARVQSFLREAPFGNLTALARIMEVLPAGTVVHLGNSATIRYSQLLPARSALSYFSNRGISGIDGSLSTAVGSAMVSDRQHVLIMGDLSFVYDSNGLWNKDFPENLKLVVLNDGGGGIFRLLDGPDRMDFFEEFSVTHHPVSIELLAGAFGRRFARVSGMEELENQLPALCDPDSRLTVLEVDTTGSENSGIFKSLFNKSDSKDGATSMEESQGI
jgi:2-succinyl-5-enolpyruvyl-6-hydroxy-3-cyclohexene-1-carboxylate synthase